MDAAPSRRVGSGSRGIHPPAECRIPACPLCHPSTGPPRPQFFFFPPPSHFFSCSFFLHVTGTSIGPTLTSSGCWDPSHSRAVSCLWEQPSITPTASSCPAEGLGAKWGREPPPAMPDIIPAVSPPPGRMRPAALHHRPTACPQPGHRRVLTPVPSVPGHGSRYPSGVAPSALTASPSREHPPHPSPTSGDPLPARATAPPPRGSAPPVARSR